jgi:hypothetical protein
MPEVALAGTAHDVDSAQLPQSIKPVEVSVKQAGWVWAVTGEIVATFRAPNPA